MMNKKIYSIPIFAILALMIIPINFADASTFNKDDPVSIGVKARLFGTEGGEQQGQTSSTVDVNDYVHIVFEAEVPDPRELQYSKSRYFEPAISPTIINTVASGFGYSHNQAFIETNLFGDIIDVVYAERVGGSDYEWFHERNDFGGNGIATHLSCLNSSSFPTILRYA